MKICVIHPTISKESAEELAQALGWDVCNPFKTNRRDSREYLGVFNYGCNRKIVANNVINKSKSVATCINKVATYEVFKKAQIPTVNYVTRKQDIPKEWDIVVVRKEVDGAQAKDLDYWYQGPEWRRLHPFLINCPDGALFTEYFEHAKELRVMVFCGQVVGVYKKVHQGGNMWVFVEVRGHDVIKEHAIIAAKALDIDFVGFDVLVNKDNEYKFLEANSGCILTDEMIQSIKKYL